MSSTYTIPPLPGALLATGLVFTTACGDDSVPMTPGASSSSSGTTTGASTSQPDETTGSVSTSSSDSGSTAGPADTTMGSSSSSGEESSSGIGPIATTSAGDIFECANADLGSQVPHTEVGSTIGLGNNVTASCAFEDGNDEDILYEWTAPAEGTYVFDTFGSRIDTILSLLSACDGEEIACNDDAPGQLQSEIVIDLLEGDHVLIAVDGWNRSGTITLNISEVGGGTDSDTGFDTGLFTTGGFDTDFTTGGFDTGSATSFTTGFETGFASGLTTGLTTGFETGFTSGATTGSFDTGFSPTDSGGGFIASGSDSDGGFIASGSDSDGGFIGPATTTVSGGGSSG